MAEAVITIDDFENGPIEVPLTSLPTSVLKHLASLGNAEAASILVKRS
jgi:hypothetical protein